MRIFRFIALLAVLGVLWVVGGLVWSLMSPAESRMDAFASSRIRRECGWSSNCKIHTGDLFEGDWDTVYVFGAGITQPELDFTLGPGKVRAREHDRIVVLEKNNHILRADHAPAPLDKPLDGEIEFEDDDHRELKIVRYNHDQALRVIGFPLQPSGRFYVLTATDEK